MEGDKKKVPSVVYVQITVKEVTAFREPYLLPGIPMPGASTSALLIYTPRSVVRPLISYWFFTTD